MPLRFQRRKSFLGGLVHFHVSKGGLSVSLGVPGARVNLPIFGRQRPPRVTAGIPGSGISFSESLK